MAKNNIGRGKGQKKRVYGKKQNVCRNACRWAVSTGRRERERPKERKFCRCDTWVIYKESYLKFYKGHCNLRVPRANGYCTRPLSMPYLPVWHVKRFFIHPQAPTAHSVAFLTLLVSTSSRDYQPVMCHLSSLTNSRHGLTVGLAGLIQEQCSWNLSFSIFWFLQGQEN